jgi:hypothetical protein
MTDHLTDRILWCVLCMASLLTVAGSVAGAA